MPKKITMPWPPQRVESASVAFLKQLSMSCQLFITHTSPEGEIARSVCICSPPPTYPPGGAICWPVWKPGGQFSVRTPQSSVIGLFGIAKLEIQTLSLPSTVAAHGPGSPPPVNGEPGYWLPSGRRSVTLPPDDPPVCLAMAFARISSPLPPIFRTSSMWASTSPPRTSLPRRFVTQTLPWLSIPIPLLLHPVSNFCASIGFEAGKRTTCPAIPLLTHMRSC